MSAPAITEADILNEVVAPSRAGLSVPAARSILSMQFSPAARARIGKLLEANNRGKISRRARAELEKYLRVGQFLDLMHAKARLSLSEAA